ncbi:MAG TPA: transglycosylase domain-containing protein, partial [Roseateles sp.]|nr:transglycosylase domain-containing protein [Roseateles sp.]
MAGPRFDGLDKRKVASHIGVMMAVAAVLGIVVSGLAIPFAGVFGFTAKDLANSASDLPKELTTEALPQRTEIVDAVGDPIATLYDQNRVNVQLSQISRTMVKAIVAIEDYRFYQHGALDMKGTLRALFTNSTQGGVVQGGSSITQQLVKQTLVNQADTVAEQKAAIADTFARKLRELRYAIALERLHSKDWILQQYLNTVYFGDGAYGIQAAAQHFFNVNAKDLTLPQAALLAGLVRSPEALNPTDNPQGAIERRNVVLDRMAQLNVISYQRAEHFKKRGLHLDVQPTANGCVNSSAPFFCSYVVSYLMKDNALGNTKKERERVLWGGGLTIQTTMHAQFQHWATVAATTHVSKHDNAIGAIAEVEPGTGDVWALAQSRPMGTDAGAGQTFLNYTVPKKFGSANGFQPGSTFKFFVMAAALEEGLPETTSFYAPSTLNVSEGEFRTCRGMYPSTQIWPAHNSTDATDQTLELAMDAAGQAMWEWDVVRDHMRFTGNWEQVLGYEPEHVANTRDGWLSLVMASDRDRADACLDAFLHGRAPGYDCEYRIRHASGSWVWITVQGKVVDQDDQGRPLRMIGVARDVTTEHQGREELQQLAQLLQLAFDGIFVWTPAGGIEFWNHGAELQYGYTVAEALGRQPNELLRTEFPCDEALKEEALQKDGLWRGELSHTTRDGRRIVVNAVLQRVADGQERVLEITRDITEAKAYETRLLEREQALAYSQQRLQVALDAGRM